jgi:ATP-binding cassette subfamily F protein 3
MEINMIELGINNITKYYGATKIFEKITFDVKTGERIGLIGQNGCGKTTILKILMGIEDYQEGVINLRKGSKMGYLNQIPTYENGTKTIDVIRMAFDHIFLIKKQLNQLETQFETLGGNELEKAMNQYGKLSGQYELDGGYELETRINKITEGLQITDSLKEMVFDSLSGGEKTRVMLAKILLEEPDILLLDEPTNHLDLETIGWLEDFLNEYKGSVLIISHDRYFLDSVVNRVIELEYSKANLYYGNYSYYVVEKERRFLLDLKNYQNQQKKIEQMENQIKRYRIWGEMRDSDKMFKRAKELEKRLEKMDTIDRPSPKTRKVRFGNEVTTRTGKIVLSTEEVGKSFENKVLLKNIDLTLLYQDSACIIGKNGCGKSTFLKIILGELEPDSGIIKIGAGVKIGYLPQHVAFHDEEQTILEYFSSLHNITGEEARSQLARVLFMKDDVHKKIKFLSGGEKSRLKLCSLTFEKVNFMILDEPTNHLDIDSREVLEETLSEYEGTLLFVSHDRYFINKVADKVIEIEDCSLKIYDGDYSYYLDEVKKMKEKMASEVNITIGSKKSGRENNYNQGIDIAHTKQSGHNTTTLQIRNDGVMHNSKNSIEQRRKQIIITEQEIEKIECELKVLDEDMNLHNSDIKYLEKAYSEKEELEKSLETAYKKWEQLYNHY